MAKSKDVIESGNVDSHKSTENMNRNDIVAGYSGNVTRKTIRTSLPKIKNKPNN